MINISDRSQRKHDIMNNISKMKGKNSYCKDKSEVSNNNFVWNQNFLPKSGKTIVILLKMGEYLVILKFWSDEYSSFINFFHLCSLFFPF